MPQLEPTLLFGALTLPAIAQALAVCPYTPREQRTIAMVRSKVGGACNQIFHIISFLQKAHRQEVGEQG
jgi:hypothetical protein